MGGNGWQHGSTPVVTASGGNTVDYLSVQSPYQSPYDSPYDLFVVTTMSSVILCEPSLIISLTYSLTNLLTTRYKISRARYYLHSYSCIRNRPLDHDYIIIPFPSHVTNDICRDHDFEIIFPMTFPACGESVLSTDVFLVSDLPTLSTCSPCSV